MRLSFFEKLQVGNNGHKNKEICEISQNYNDSRKKPKTTLTPYLMVDSRWPPFH